MKRRRKILLVLVGTRPEAIKLAPVVVAARRARSLRCLVCLSGQHQNLAVPALAHFGLRPDIRLPPVRHQGDLTRLVGHATAALGRVVERQRPDWLVVQGDTTTAMLGAMCGFHLRIPVAHVEAGLRSGSMEHPFPEEFNRRVISLASTLHFAPTRGSRANLLREGVPARRIHLVGNTVVDALLWTVRHQALASPFRRGCRGILVTAHRRENQGHGIRQICVAVLRLCREFRDLHVIFPVHPNPEVRRTVVESLAGLEQVSLVAPLEYPRFCRAMRAASLVISDSGGVQEEALALGTPTLVTRQVTERPEALKWRTVRLVGTHPSGILRQARLLLGNARAYQEACRAHFPFGKGDAAKRILATLKSI
jgi:UDP-N-acetylglucosamine 2-epimerase (non-hydrolysing)